MNSASFNELKDFIIKADREAAIQYLDSTLKREVNLDDLIQEGLTAAMTELGQLWDEGSVFLPEVLASAELFKECMAVIEPYQLKKGQKSQSLGKVLIGTVYGDLHDLGKNIVSIMLKSSGFEVVDLGKNVPVESFVEAIKEVKPDILGLSALLTTTLIKQKETIEAISKAGLRDKIKIIIGGAPATDSWAKEIGADAYGANAPDAVEKAKFLMKKF